MVCRSHSLSCWSCVTRDLRFSRPPVAVGHSRNGTTPLEEFDFDSQLSSSRTVLFVNIYVRKARAVSNTNALLRAEAESRAVRPPLDSSRPVESHAAAPHQALQLDAPDDPPPLPSSDSAVADAPEGRVPSASAVASAERLPPPPAAAHDELLPPPPAIATTSRTSAAAALDAFRSPRSISSLESVRSASSVSGERTANVLFASQLSQMEATFNNRLAVMERQVLASVDAIGRLESRIAALERDVLTHVVRYSDRAIALLEDRIGRS